MKDRAAFFLEPETPDDDTILGKKVILRNKKLADASDDYRWQTNPELARLDAASPLTTSFQQYLSNYDRELRYSSLMQRSFAVDAINGKHIGNCGYYNIDEMKGEAELGIMIGDCDYWDKGYGIDVVTTLVSHVFRQTDIKRIYLKTLDSNTRAQKCFKKCGFTPYDRMTRDGFSFILMEMHHKQWQEQQTET